MLALGCTSRRTPCSARRSTSGRRPASWRSASRPPTAASPRCPASLKDAGRTAAQRHPPELGRQEVDHQQADPHRRSLADPRRPRASHLVVRALAHERDEPVALAEHGRHPEHRPQYLRARDARPGRRRPATRISSAPPTTTGGTSSRPSATASGSNARRRGAGEAVRGVAAIVAVRGLFCSATDLAGRLALVVPPPARLNGKPVTYNRRGHRHQVHVAAAHRVDRRAGRARAGLRLRPDHQLAGGLRGAYRADLLAMDGEAPACSRSAAAA